jgi:hypothetical protein
MSAEDVSFVVEEIPSVGRHKLRIQWCYDDQLTGFLSVAGTHRLSRDEIAAIVARNVQPFIERESLRIRHWGSTRVTVMSENDADAEMFAKWLVARSPEKFQLQGDGRSNKPGKAMLSWQHYLDSCETQSVTKPINVYVSPETPHNLSICERLRRRLVSRIELNFLRAAVTTRVHKHE